MKNEGLNSLKNEVDTIRNVLVGSWLLCLFIIGMGALMVTFNGDISFKKPNFENLSHMGGFFNIITSLTGVATVWLLAKAIIIQKTELDKVSSSMDEQNEKLQTQIDSSENEEKINRAMRLYEEWLEIKNQNASKTEKDLDEILEKNLPLLYFINRVTMLKGSSFTRHVDLNLLKEILDREGIQNTIGHVIIKLNGQSRIHKDTYEKKIEVIKNKYKGYGPTYQSSKRTELTDAELDFSALNAPYSDNITLFEKSLENFNASFR